ncbi:MAG: phosphatase PAP2 family protein [Chitinophagales bacterium]|nr:phosphatase PAP2 family protein [Chitinophagales bacterium]
MSFRIISPYFTLQFLLFFSLLVPQSGWAQTKYELKYKTDIPIGAVGLGTLTASYFMGRKSEAPTPQQIQLLNRDDIWKFDRSATYRWSPKCATASDVFMYSSFVMPGLLFINKNVRQERYVTLLYAETMALSAGITSLVKELTHRYRPYAYNENVSMEKKLKKDTRMSFFSGHTSLVASSSFFMAKVYSDLNPNSKLKPLVWTSCALLPAIVGILRYCAGKHYPTDIIVGYATGAAIGFFVPYIHKKKEFRP